eukprot:COSAG06_NODE_57500_length_280_cov_0.574586_1_plen_26_part_01
MSVDRCTMARLDQGDFAINRARMRTR